MMKLILLLFFAIVNIANAQKSIIQNSIQDSNKPTSNNDKIASPFLSTTLSTTITTVSPDSDFDTERKTLFSETLTKFLTKIFKDQQVYHVEIIGVHIFDDHILEDGHYLNQKQANSQNVLSFTTVISAEYTQESDINTIPNDTFQKMVIHVCDKFGSHLVQFVQDTDDPYFMDVDSVVVSDFERVPAVAATAAASEASGENEVFGMSESTVNTASIIAIVVGGLVIVVLIFASIKYYRWV